jgi:peptide subunit release factor 1 (eRF1)
MFTQEDLQELLAFDGGNDKVVSVYLDADTGEQSSEVIKRQVRALLRGVEGHEEDVEAIENYINFSHDWSKPGLALFSCQPREFFRAYPAAVAFRNRVRIGRKPYVKPLAHLLDHYAHYGVILVDRIGARFFDFHLGELQEVSGTMGEDVRKLKRGSGSSAIGMRGGESGARHEDEAVQRNLREAAAAAQQFFAKRNIRRLFLGGTAENVAQFRDYLPKQLLSCLAGAFPVDMEANENEVRNRSLTLLREANAQREEKLVESMITAAAKGNQAVVGLADTLQAVSDGRVQTLIISDGYRTSGYSYNGLNYLAADRTKNPFGEGTMAEVEDVVEAAVARTMEQGGHVEVISENPHLENAGRIGAILRY